jgi:hypothetical protein
MDYLLPVAEKELDIAKIVISSLTKFDKESRITVVTKSELLKEFFGDRIRAIDEDKLIEGLSYETVKDIISRIINQSDRAGWYFQQFIKMGYSMVADSNYVVWDADTVMLNKIDFLDNEKQILYFNNTKEHLAYLSTINKLLPDIEPLKNISFVTEKMMIDRSLMMEIIQSIEARFGKPFYQSVLENIAIPDIKGSGFSEFATYANYAFFHHPNDYKLLKSNHFRSGTVFFGELPTLDDLRPVSNYYNSIGFEKWHKRIKINKRLSVFLIDLFGFKIYTIFVRKFNGIIQKFTNTRLLK